MMRYAVTFYIEFDYCTDNGPYARCIYARVRNGDEMTKSQKRHGVMDQNRKWIEWNKVELGKLLQFLQSIHYRFGQKTTVCILE